MSHAARYARTLLRQASQAFPVASRERVVAALPVLDEFLAAPGPLTFLSASRVLTVLKRDARTTRMAVRVADRVFARGKVSVARVVGVDAATLDALSGLEVDPQAGARLHALAHMLTAYQELAGRSEAAKAALRKQFDAVKAKGAAAAGKKKPTSRLGA
jgi:hypothetical protein